MEVSLYPVSNEQDHISGIVLRARDVNDLITANHQLYEQNLRQEQFIAVLAHDVREPLRTIRNYLNLAVEEADGSLSQQAVSHLNVASRSTERLSSLVTDLLTFLKVDGQSIPLQATQLANVISDAIEDLQCLCKSSDATVTAAVDVEVEGNHVWLRLCLQNLISNAIKFARPGVKPIVHIAQQSTDAEVYIRIMDNGIGIAEINFERIFKPFLRLHARTDVEGAGLGLSLCHRIAYLHGGSLYVECSSERGTTFLLTLNRFNIYRSSHA